MWTHTPPFGRVSVLASYRNGTIVELRPSSLD